jgi:hypothetical protein
MMKIVRFFCLINIRENLCNLWQQNFVPLQHKKINLKQMNEDCFILHYNYD